METPPIYVRGSIKNRQGIIQAREDGKHKTQLRRKPEQSDPASGIPVQTGDTVLIIGDLSSGTQLSTHCLMTKVRGIII